MSWTDDTIPERCISSRNQAAPPMLETPHRRSHAQSLPPCYGPIRRLPVHKLNKIYSHRCSSTRVTEAESLHARIVNDKPLLSSVETLSHLRGDMETLRDYVDLCGYQVCAHFTLREEPPYYTSFQLPSYYAPCDQSYKFCTFCLTDF
jgi:hypothetical protein